MEVINNLLKTYKVELSVASRNDFESALIRKVYEKDEMILDAGQRCTDLYIIEKGMLRQFYYKEGRDISEHFSCEGDFSFCIESLFLKEPTSLLMQSLEPSIVHLLDYEVFCQLCDIYPDVNLLYRRIFENDLVISQRKADSWRFLNAKERYDRFCVEYPQAALRVPIAHIATYLLMSPETLSRIRSGTLG